jgi:hypothetical protein
MLHLSGRFLLLLPLDQAKHKAGEEQHTSNEAKRLAGIPLPTDPTPVHHEAGVIVIVTAEQRVGIPVLQYTEDSEPSGREEQVDEGREEIEWHDGPDDGEHCADCRDHDAVGQAREGADAKLFALVEEVAGEAEDDDGADELRDAQEDVDRARQSHGWGGIGKSGNAQE